MSTDFVPPREADLVTFLTNLSTKITATPAAFGVLVPQAAQLQTLADDFIALYTTCSEPDTRTPAKIQAKKDAKRDAIAFVRVIVRQIQGTESVTNEQRVSLMLPVRDTEPTPVPPPQISPGIGLTVTGPHALAVRIWDPLNPDSGRKPAGVQGTAIFTCTGEAPLPVGDAGWVWQGQTTRMKGNVSVNPTLPGGTKVWVCGVFYNAKGEHGPVSNAVSAYLPMTDAQPLAA